jgi:hypothetical protein
MPLLQIGCTEPLIGATHSPVALAEQDRQSVFFAHRWPA